MRVLVEPGFDDIEVIIHCAVITPDVEAMAERLRGPGERLTGLRDGATHLIDQKDVLYFESVDKRSFIYTADAVYETPLRLYEIEEHLSDAGFLRTSKAQIVNIAKIVSLCPDFGGRMEILLPNDERLIASRHYARLLAERLKLK